ncbi:MAG: hypothetical protein GAK28_01449 [Luteibacter sp.]|uniref:hypothetical protein n=1 Tax=Luteibacter sp. TaxID=1886636 RepID=UPI001381B35C|nr:hypothetical protein [Luteibacter sp.]KAF1007972.1 MAG: hypothetical protein GAK28_01449 [Luteibacter sp.]
MTRRLAALACVALATQVAFGADCPADLPPTGALIGQGLLDTNTPDAKRQELAHLLLCSAVAGNDNSMEVAGSLYRWGPRHPAHVFEEDHDKARDLLNGAAAQGRLSAMLKLAELELADGHAREAMIWVQVERAYYLQRANATKDGGDTVAGAGYFTMLLKRVNDALGPVDDQKLIVDVNARLAGLEKLAAAHPRTRREGPGLGQLHRPARFQLAAITNTERDEGSYAQYFVEVAPNGDIARRWLIDAYPEPSSGVRLARAVEQMHWDPLKPGETGMRYVIFPISMSSIRHGYKVEGS